VAKFHAFFSGRAERFTKAPPAGENFHEVKARALQSLYEIDARYAGKNILLITHEAVGWLLMVGAQGFNDHEAEAAQSEDRYFLKTAESRPLPFVALPHNQAYELDFHRPFIDEVKLNCVCGGEMARVKEVMDVWFDSGSMPFAQDHYPFSVTDQELYYPADFISEAIDQTRGWFYTMHAVGVLLGKGKAYKNVVCLGHILDAEGKKMSKSLGNIVNPWTMIDKYGADALRLWMYSVNQPGDSKNFDEKTVDEVGKKVFNLASNVLAFYQTYADLSVAPSPDSTNILDRWILARLNQLIAGVTTNLDSYNLFEPTRAIRDFVGDLSQWYLRRSRERFKSDNQADARAAAATTRYVLTELAKVMAPFAPFFAEELYLSLKGNKESVHLEPWPESGKSDEEIITAMQLVRQLVSGGLEARAKAAIKVRQPLKELKAKSAPLSAELTQLIQDEVNVKAVIFDPNLATVVELDLTITSELKEEGELRDLIREIQEWRKESGLKAGEQAEVLVPVAKRSLAEKYEREIRVATNASAFRYE
jgi:isoleucyl-tRNA synthetase